MLPKPSYTLLKEPSWQGAQGQQGQLTFVLRNASGAPARCWWRCRLRCRLSPGWEPKTRGHELPSLWITKCTKSRGISLMWRDTKGEEVSGEEKDLCTSRLESIKAMGFLGWGNLSSETPAWAVPVWLHCEKMVLWNKTSEILLWEAQGRTSQETWCEGKWDVQGDKQGTCGHPGAAPHEGA